MYDYTKNIPKYPVLTPALDKLAKTDKFGVAYDPHD